MADQLSSRAIGTFRDKAVEGGSGSGKIDGQSSALGGAGGGFPPGHGQKTGQEGHSRRNGREDCFREEDLSALSRFHLPVSGGTGVVVKADGDERGPVDSAGFARGELRLRSQAGRAGSDA